MVLRCLASCEDPRASQRARHRVPRPLVGVLAGKERSGRCGGTRAPPRVGAQCEAGVQGAWDVAGHCHLGPAGCAPWVSVQAEGSACGSGGRSLLGAAVAAAPDTQGPFIERPPFMDFPWCK